MKKKSWFSKNIGWMIFLFLIIIIILLGFLFWGKISMLISGLIPPLNNESDGGGNDEITTTSCEETDGGLSYYMVGHATDQDGMQYYDKCENNVVLTEYYCHNNEVDIKTFSCPEGYTCLQTRSGGYCNPLPEGIDGDILLSGSGDGGFSILGNVPVTTINIGDISYLPTNCDLGIKLTTNWWYENPAQCQPPLHPTLVGVNWELYDSIRLKYARIDPSPFGTTVELCGFEYDGSTPWEIWISKINDNPSCAIGYNYQYDIIACNCQ